MALKAFLNAFKKAFKGQKKRKSLKNYDVTSFDNFSNFFYDFEFPRRSAIATAILNA